MDKEYFNDDKYTWMILINKAYFINDNNYGIRLSVTLRCVIECWWLSSVDNIHSYYVDGVSITQGYPRKHIRTLIADGVSKHN